MRLKKILDGVSTLKVKNFKNYNIKAITHISKDVIKDSIFIAIKGSEFNGNDYVLEAIGLGAKCVITEEDICIENATVVVVNNVRRVMSIVAKNFYNKVCDTMDIIGVIGSSGKTTTAYIIKQILGYSGNKIGLIGTNTIYIDNIVLDNKFTTPDPLELHYIFYQMKMLGVNTVVMEVSAQAISQYKMYGIRLRVGVFTNISEEHLDFFGSMENYIKVKSEYFNIKNMDEAVINVDDTCGRDIAYDANLPILSYGIDNPANTFAVDIDSKIDRLNFVVNSLDDVYKISTKLVGIYNVYNIMSAITVARILGLDRETILSAVNNLECVEGRFNVFDLGKGNKIIVDFAHTVDSIEKLLSFVRGLVTGRLITVFGCVGYSNKEKRQKMMKAAVSYSDFVIVTTDNRGEVSFEDIERDMVESVHHSKYISIEDRKGAIHFAFGMLGKNDTVVVMGKGAEKYQTIGKEKIPYSDLDIVQELIKKLEVK